MNWYKLAQLNNKQPWQMTQKEFVNYHITGFIPSHHYDDYKTIDGIRSFNQKENFPVLYDTKQFGNTIVEFKKSGKPNKYVKTDPYDDLKILRDNQGKALYLSDEEMKAKGLATEDQTIVAFVGNDPIGFASNEFGATGVWVVENYQNKGIGSYLLKEFRKTMKPSSRLGQATNAGINLTMKYHKELVKDALQEEKPVPEEVLKDYPDLMNEMNESQRETPTTITSSNDNWYKKAQDIDFATQNPKARLITMYKHHWDYRTEDIKKELKKLYPEWCEKVDIDQEDRKGIIEELSTLCSQWRDEKNKYKLKENIEENIEDENVIQFPQ